MLKNSLILQLLNNKKIKYLGELGSAFRWLDFLAEARQSVWQILPLGPTSYEDSPYQTTSVFAGNPLLIDLSNFANAGYIS